MGTSAKRLGLEIQGDLETELRFRRIETELERRALANEDELTNVARARGIPPQVTGLRLLGRTPGAVTIAWNVVQISDLRRYDVEFAQDEIFSTEKQTFRTRDTNFEINTAGAGGVTLFARVRAVNNLSQKGPYSIVLNTFTGQAATTEIADDAVTPNKQEDTSAGSIQPGPGDADKILQVKDDETGYELVTLASIADDIVGNTNLINFSGVKVFLGVGEIISATSEEEIEWDTVIFDDGGWFTNPSTDLVVPTGVTRVLVQGQIAIETIDQNDLIHVEFHKNGIDFTGRGQQNFRYGNTRAVWNFSMIDACVAGDTYSLNVVNDAGVSRTVSSSGLAWFSAMALKRE